MVTETHQPPETDEVTYTVWIRPEKEDKPSTYRGVVDAMKQPNGVIKIAHSDGVTDTRTGEIMRLKQEGLKDE